MRNDPNTGAKAWLLARLKRSPIWTHPNSAEPSPVPADDAAVLTQIPSTAAS